MKVILESLSKLPQASVKVVTALEDAGTSMATESSKLLELVVDAVTQFSEGMQTLVGQLQELPALLDPSPVVNACSKELEQAFQDLKEVANESLRIPDPVMDSLTGFEEILPSARSALSTLETLPNRLTACAPDAAWTDKATEDVRTQSKSWKSAVSDANDTLGRAYSDMESAMGRWTNVTAADPKSVAAIQTDLLGELQTTRVLVNQVFETTKSKGASAKSLVADVAEGVKHDIQTSLDNSDELIQSVIEDFLSPIRDLLAKIEKLQEGVTASSEHACATLDTLEEKVQLTLDKVDKPVALFKAQLDELLSKLHESAGDLRSTMGLALEPVDALEDAVARVAQALDEVAAAINDLVHEIVAVLDHLSELVVEGKQTLQEIPEQFELVRDKLKEAIQQIEAIREQIPVFVSQALNALDMASTELSKAEERCTNAISVCTKYQLKVPPLMVARGLFMSAKTSLGPIKTSVKAAATTVQKAGQTADGLVEQALEATRQIDPLILDARGLVQGAVDQVIAQLDLLEQQVGQVKGKVLEGPPFLDEQLNALKTELQTVVRKASDTAHKAVDDIQLDPMLDEMQSQLDEMTEEILGVISKQTDHAKDGIAATLSEVKTCMAQAIETFGDVSQPVLSNLENVEPLLQKKAGELRDLLQQGGDKGIAWVDDAQRELDSVVDDGLSHINNAQAAWDAYCDQCQSSLESIAKTAAPAVDAASKVIAAVGDANLTALQHDSVAAWTNDTQNLVEGHLSAGLESFDQASTDVNGVVQDVKNGKQAADDNLASIRKMDSISDEAKDAIGGVQDSAKKLAVNADNAATEASAELDKVSEAAKNGDGAVSKKMSAFAAENKKMFDTASDGADEAQASQERAATEFKKANGGLADSIASTQQQAAALTEKAQAACDHAKSEVAVAKAQVDEVKVKIAAAQSVLAAEVVNQGGAPANDAPDTSTAKSEQSAQGQASASGGGSNSSTETQQPSAAQAAASESAAGAAPSTTTESETETKQPSDAQAAASEPAAGAAPSTTTESETETKQPSNAQAAASEPVAGAAPSTKSKTETKTKTETETETETETQRPSEAQPLPSDAAVAGAPPTEARQPASDKAPTPKNAPAPSINAGQSTEAHTHSPSSQPATDSETSIHGKIPVTAAEKPAPVDASNDVLDQSVPDEKDLSHSRLQPNGLDDPESASLEGKKPSVEATTSLSAAPDSDAPIQPVGTPVGSTNPTGPVVDSVDDKETSRGRVEPTPFVDASQGEGVGLGADHHDNLSTHHSSESRDPVELAPDTPIEPLNSSTHAPEQHELSSQETLDNSTAATDSVVVPGVDSHGAFNKKELGDIASEIDKLLKK